METSESEGENYLCQRSMRLERDKYIEWKDKKEFKRWEKNRMKRVEEELKEEGLVEEEDIFMGTMMVGGWEEKKII